MNNLRDNKGAISLIVIITLLFFTVILVGTYLLNSTIRKSQIKSQMVLKETYGRMSLGIGGTDSEGNIVTASSPEYAYKKGVEENMAQAAEENNTKIFEYIGDYQIYKVSKTGNYIIECCGASSGRGFGKGAYTKGTINLTANTFLYFYVGGKGAVGTSGSVAGGYNGGGNLLDCCYDGNNEGGGGATDVRMANGSWNNSQSLQSRIMVAAGAGGGVLPINTTSHGGDLSSIQSNAVNSSYTAAGATQSSGFALGQGESAIRASGGGGYYGGHANTYTGSGGSSYISGHSGCSTYSGKVFSDTQMINGANNTFTRESGHGWASIRYIGN